MNAGFIGKPTYEYLNIQNPHKHVSANIQVSKHQITLVTIKTISQHIYKYSFRLPEFSNLNLHRTQFQPTKNFLEKYSHKKVVKSKLLASTS